MAKRRQKFRVYAIPPQVQGNSETAQQNEQQSNLRFGITKIDTNILVAPGQKMRGEIEKLEGFNLYKEYCIFRKNLVVG